jgi:arabinose-5-phosphate isomerase
MTTVVDDQDVLLGIFTDGDLRRNLDNIAKLDIYGTKISDIMSTGSKVCTAEMLAAEAMNIMEENSITVLPVMAHNKVVGAVHLHELIKAGLA